MKLFALQAILFLFLVPGFAQENMGIVHDNFLPTQGMKLNPSAIADQKPWLSFQFFSLGIYARNNLAFIENSKPQWSDELSEASFDLTKNDLRAYLDAEVYGPSVSFTIQDHAIGLHTAVRSFTSIKNIPKELGEFITGETFEEISEGHYTLKNLDAQSLTWGEVGLTYGYIFKKEGNDLWALGIGINRLMGINAGGLDMTEAKLEIRDTLDYGMVSELNGRYYFSQPSFYAGRGWSTNLGVTFKKMEDDVSNHIPHSPKGNCIVPDYRYKIGISLIDLGSISFKNKSETAHFDQQFNTDELEEIVDADVNDAIILDRSFQFKSSTPSALSIQADMMLADHIYANGSIIKGLGFLSQNGPSRQDVISASIRYESRWLGIGIPLSFQNYSNIQLGLALRAGPIIIGSDHVLPFLIKSDIYATDIYAALQIPILRNPSCVEKGKAKKAKTKSEAGYPPCPKW